MAHTFGESWREEKLAVMRNYFAAYAQALKNRSFAKWYIDASVGTDERNAVKGDRWASSNLIRAAPQAGISLPHAGSPAGPTTTHLTSRILIHLVVWTAGLVGNRHSALNERENP